MTMQEAFVDIHTFREEVEKIEGYLPDRLRVRNKSAFGKQTNPMDAKILHYPIWKIDNIGSVNKYDQLDDSTTFQESETIVNDLASRTMTLGEYDFLISNPNLSIIMNVGRTKYFVIDTTRSEVEYTFLPLIADSVYKNWYIVFARVFTRNLFSTKMKPSESIPMGTVFPEQVQRSLKFLEEQKKNKEKVIAITDRMMYRMV